MVVRRHGSHHYTNTTRRILAPSINIMLYRHQTTILASRIGKKAQMTVYTDFWAFGKFYYYLFDLLAIFYRY